jgi:N-acyl-D-aspartate/D-glutamate deacylase
MRYNRRQFIKTSAIATSGIIVGCSVKNQFDVIIKNGLVIDGSGSKPFSVDLGIIGDKISVLDQSIGNSAEIIIDAKDRVVAPGFIDIHTHTDKELIINPTADSKIFQGVTTEIGGNCGYSPFPFNDKDLKVYDEEFFERYGENADWRNISEFYERLEKGKMSINYASFTGHGNLRAYIVGKNDVAPTFDQMKKMKEVLALSMEMGSLGLSTGLEYSPGSYANTEELIELSKVVSKNNGVYATHMRNEDDTVEEAIEEALRICREANVSLQISHLKAGNPANWHKVDNMLKMIEDSYNSGLPVLADRYPYVAYGTGLSAFIPLWARQGDTDELLNRLQDKSQFRKIEEYTQSRGKRIGGWDKVVLSSCFTEDNKKFEGKAISDAAAESKMTEIEFIRNIIIEERNRVGIIGFAMSEENIKKVLSHPLVMVGSDGSAVSPVGKLSHGKPHPRFYGTFPRVLGKYAREEKFFDLSTAVKKMTSMPAEKLGLNKRGLIKKGNYADIVIFNPEEVSDKSTFVNPHQLATGIDYVIVNGKVIVKKGKHNGITSGKVIRHLDT